MTFNSECTKGKKCLFILLLLLSSEIYGETHIKRPVEYWKKSEAIGDTGSRISIVI